MPAAVPAAVVPLAGLVALLAVAYRHPRGRVEVVVGLLAVAAVLATGTLTAASAHVELEALAPVVGFLVAVVVVADRCRVAGVFTALGARLGRVRDERLITVVFGCAVAITVALSLDATVVLLTPVVLAVSAHGFRVGELACVRLANSASLLLPVANLTNLLAMRELRIGFVEFLVLMAPSWLVVLAVEYAVLGTRARAQARHGAHPPAKAPLASASGPPAPLPPIPWRPVTVVTTMLFGFAAGSGIGVEPVWVATAAAVVLVAGDARAGRLDPRELAHSAHLPFAVFVLCLGLVVAALGDGPLGRAVTHLVPPQAALPGLLVVAALGTVLANLVNNIPATLLLVPAIAPLGTTALLALLIGVNVGSSMTWTGSLANLLWRRVLTRAGRPVPSREFHLIGLVTSPAAIVAGVVVLHGWSRLLP